MGWEFAACWVEESEPPWQWMWRRIADDSGAVIAESASFATLERCIVDAKAHEFDEEDCGPVD
jgi:hypothetical protein